jgi:hypothetical protein
MVGSMVSTTAVMMVVMLVGKMACAKEEQLVEL